MTVRLIGMDLVDFWRARGARIASGNDATLASPDDTNSFALLVRRAVRQMAPQVVLDVGCGCGIPTMEAVAAGAPHAIGLDVLPANIALTRSNATRAGLGDRITARLMGWEQVARGRLDRAGIDLVVANPPYLPAAAGLAVDGGPDGARFLRAIIAGVPKSASGLALLFGSLSNPVAVLATLAKEGWRVESMFAHAVRFGGYTSAAATLRALHRLRRLRAAFFCDVAAEDPLLAGHSYLVFGIVATRGRAPSGLEASVTTLVHAFERFGLRALDAVRLPVPFEAASYFDPEAAVGLHVDA